MVVGIVGLATTIKPSAARGRQVDVLGMLICS
jgi:hypothetical protein